MKHFAVHKYKCIVYTEPWVVAYYSKERGAFIASRKPATVAGLDKEE